MIGRQNGCRELVTNISEEELLHKTRRLEVDDDTLHELASNSMR